MVKEPVKVTVENDNAISVATRLMKAAGAVVHVTNLDFGRILSETDKPLVVVSYQGWPSKRHCYLTAFNGLVFFTKSKESLLLPENVEVISSQRISVPE